MTPIQGSSTPQEITGDGTGTALPEAKQNDNEIKDAEAIPDVEYDEFKQYDDNVIEMKSSEAKTPLATTERPPLKEGEMYITDMTIDQLRVALMGAIKQNDEFRMRINGFLGREELAKKIESVWNNKDEIKARYFMLRDNPKAKGVKIR